MKYLIAVLGLTIIVLRTVGISIDLTSIGLFIFISFVLLIKNFNDLKKISGFGVKVEFDKELRKLATDTERLEEQTEENKKRTGLAGPPQTIEQVDENSEFTKETIVQIDSKNPKLTLINLAIEIERALREILIRHFGDNSKRPISATRMADKIFGKIDVQGNYRETFHEFWKLRNSIIHSDARVSDDKIISLIDSGLRILKTLRAIDTNLDGDGSLQFLD